MKATVTLEYEDEKTASAVGNAVSPDNFKTPKGLTVKTVSHCNQVVTVIDAETTLATFIATIDDLLFSASAAEKTLGMIKSHTPQPKQTSS